MLVTLFGSSAYPERLTKLVKSLDRSLEFEIVVCGPRTGCENILEMDGVPFKYIYSDFKPVQCSMIAATHASGDYLLHIVDDIYFDKLSGLSNLMYEFNQLSSNHSEPVLMSTRLRRDDYSFKDADHYLYGDLKFPIPVSLLCARSVFFEVSGFSAAFVTSMADADLLWRAIKKLGAKFYLSSTVVVEVKNPNSLSLFDVYGKSDINKLVNISSGRAENIFFPISEIQDRSFGPSGMWKFKSSDLRLLIKKIHFLRLKIKSKLKSLI